MRRGRLPTALVSLGVSLALVGCAVSESGTPEASATSGPTERFQAPRSLESYRYTLTLDLDGSLLDQNEAPSGLDVADTTLNIAIEGQWVSPGQEHSTTDVGFGVLETSQETVRIGEQVWTSVAGGAWQERGPLTAPGALVGQEVPLSPDVILGLDPAHLEQLATDLAGRPHTVEEIDGRTAQHWQLDDQWFDEYATYWDGVLGVVPRDRGMEMTIDVWADLETGVGILLRVAGEYPDRDGRLSLEMRLLDLNDPSIVVEPPPEEVSGSPQASRARGASTM